MKTINVVAAIITRPSAGFDKFTNRGTEIFCTQRGYGEWKDYWEFPGGKIEPGEKPEEALKREIREELSAEIAVGELLTTVEYDYPNFHLSMRCYICSLISGELTLLEHEAARWLTKDELHSVNWLPADEGIVELLENKRIGFLRFAGT